jgi:hypothetical protein
MLLDDRIEQAGGSDQAVELIAEIRGLEEQDIHEAAKLEQPRPKVKTSILAGGGEDVVASPDPRLIFQKM